MSNRFNCVLERFYGESQKNHFYLLNSKMPFLVLGLEQPKTLSSIEFSLYLFIVDKLSVRFLTSV